MRVRRKTPEELKAAAALRQRRYVARKAAAERGDAYADAILGFGPPGQPAPPPPEGKSSGDIAKMLRDRYIAIITGMSDEDLLNKDLAPAMKVALTSQTIIDKRAAESKKQGNAELAFSIIAMLAGKTPLALDDGLTIDGEAIEVDETDG